MKLFVKAALVAVAVVSVLIISSCDSPSTEPSNDTVDTPSVKTPTTEAVKMLAADVVSMHKVTINVTVPSDAPTVFLAGNLPILGPWHPKRRQLQGEGALRTTTIDVPHGHNLQYKIAAGSWEQEGLGPSGTVMPNFSAVITADTTLTAEIAGFRKDPRELIANWRGSGVEGTLDYWTDMRSKHLKETRHVVIWLPPGYETHGKKRYKVIYMHDGQNLFDPRLSYTNVDWGVDEAMMTGVREGKYEPAIVVGIWNTPDRLWEYSPTHRASRYAKFILEELKPLVDATYAVKKGPENTFSMGSSMGGLVSLYLVQHHPDVFGACGCLSSHVTWSEQQIKYFLGEDPSSADPEPFLLRSIAAGAKMPVGQRLYFDFGTKGFDAGYGPVHEHIEQWLTDQGYEQASDFQIRQFEGADHNEASWRARVGEQLQWLLGDTSSN